MRTNGLQRLTCSLTLQIAGLSSGQLRQIKAVPGGALALPIDALRAAMDEDTAAGRVPFFVVGTVGTTSSTAVDPIKAMGELCRAHNAWLHVRQLPTLLFALRAWNVRRGAWLCEARALRGGAPAGVDGHGLTVAWPQVDAAFAGNAAICPEMRWLIDGVELADSIDINPHKWMLVNCAPPCPVIAATVRLPCAAFCSETHSARGGIARCVHCPRLPRVVSTAIALVPVPLLQSTAPRCGCATVRPFSTRSPSLPSTSATRPANPASSPTTEIGSSRWGGACGR